MISFICFSVSVITWILFVKCMLKYLHSEQKTPVVKKRDN